jgi:hypothetical protein
MYFLGVHNPLQICIDEIIYRSELFETTFGST